MNDKHIACLVTAAMGAATVGAVVLPTDEAQADASFFSNLGMKIDWTKIGNANEPMFAEYHQDGYTRVLDSAQVSNVGWWNVAQP